VLALQVLLMVNKKLKVSEIIQHQAVVNIPLEVTHGIRKNCEVPIFNSRGLENKLFAHSVFPAGDEPRTTRMGSEGSSKSSSHVCASGTGGNGQYNCGLACLDA